jgi:TetR/AcrR family transcriptional regulator, regulator of cefoperazone and chloramphenicol sensitivity
MRSSEDLTARARIRDEALRLFAEHGPDAVSVRQVAAAAGVSAALVIRHYSARDGLIAAVDDHVVHVIETLLAQLTEPGGGDAPLTSLAAAVTAQLPPGSPVPGYLGRMLTGGGPAGAALFARLYALSQQALARMVAEGQAAAGDDAAVRAAFLLVNDLAVLILRDRLSDVLGADPLSEAGLRRWGGEVELIYGRGLGARPADTP